MAAGMVAAALVPDRRWSGRAGPSPRNPAFVDAVLAPLAERAAAGVSERQLAEALYARIHPWAMQQARAQSAGLPPHADRSEVQSHVLRLAWEACARIDWDRVETWPALLERKVAHARIEAARAEDWLSRRERVHRRRFQREVAVREQQAGRPLHDTEREQVARLVAPASARVDWVKALMAARHPSTVGEVPETTDGLGLDAEVEERVLTEIRARCLHEWLTTVAGDDPRLADELRRWSEHDGTGDRALPSRLARRVEPYTPLLLGLLSEAA